MLYEYILRNSIELSQLLETQYKNFWKHIYYDNSYVLYKEAILFYKNNESGKFHNFFSGMINKYLYSGSCQYITNDIKKTFNNNSNVIPSTDDLCNLTINIIRLLDQVFEKCPKTEIPFYCYRFEHHKWTDKISNLKKGDIYYNIGINSTSINPFIYNFPSNNKDKNDVAIRFIFYIPSGSKGYYINNPFFMEPFINYKYSDNEIIGFNEFEFVLPRGNYWYIYNKIKIDNNLLIYFMELINQPKPDNLDSETHTTNNISMTKKEYVKKFSSFTPTKLSSNNVIDTYKNNQLFVKYQKNHEKKLDSEKEKIRDDFYYNFYEGFLNKKSIKSFIDSINKKIPMFEKTFKKIEISTKYQLNIMINLENKELYKYFYKNISNKITINQPFFCNLITKNEEKVLTNNNIRELYATSASLYLYKTIKGNDIKNEKSLSNNLFVKRDYPIFYSLNIRLKKPVEFIDLTPEYEPYNLKFLLYVNKPFEIKIENIEKKNYGINNSYECFFIKGSN